MIDHITLHVSDYKKSKEFFLTALAPLGYTIFKEHPGVVGLKSGGRPDFWLAGDGAGKPMHVAFAAPERKIVDDFYAAALKAGGKDNGPPGIREHYHFNYYTAFVLDPDGNNIEAVCRKSE